MAPLKCQHNLGKRSPFDYACVVDAYITVPKQAPRSWFSWLSLSSQIDLDYTTTMLHEAGHYANNHTMWAYIITAAASGAAFSFPKSLRGKAMIGSCCSKLVYHLTSRKFERDADRYAIMHSKHPENLEMEAKAFRYHHEEFAKVITTLEEKLSANEDLDPQMKRILHYTLKIAPIALRIIDTHPPFLERAEYFEKAAEELRKKQQDNQS